MKIGIDARLYRASAAGIGRYSQNLIKNLLELDRENQYVLFMTPEDEKDFLAQKITSYNYKIVKTDIGHYSVKEQVELKKIIDVEKCDLVHFTNFNFPVRYKGKFVVTIHDLTLFYFPGRSKKNFLYKFAYKYIFSQACHKAQQIIAVSESTKKDIINTFKIDPAKITVVLEAADDKTFTEPSQSFVEKIKNKYDVKAPVILYVGQWRPHKNLTGLIEAFSMLRKELPVKLALVGKVDHTYPEVFTTIDKEQVLSDIIMPGFVSEEELAAWYKIAAVFVFPSFYEGFGLPGLEAMMAGTPVAASNRTSLQEIYKNAAIYFDPEKVEEIASVLKKIITDKQLAASLVRKGYETTKLYSWVKTAQNTLKVYKSIK